MLRKVLPLAQHPSCSWMCEKPISSKQQRENVSAVNVIADGAGRACGGAHRRWTFTQANHLHRWCDPVVHFQVRAVFGFSATSFHRSKTNMDSDAPEPPESSELT